MSKEKTRYIWIDYFRVFCALLVVLIHCNPFQNSSMIKDTVAQQAVPYFFIVTGFFMASSIDNGKIVLERVKVILFLYFAWQLIWLPKTIMTYIDLYKGSTVKIILILIRRIFLCGNYAYWYLLVLAESMLFIHIIRRVTKSGIVLLVVSIAGLSLGLIYESGLDSFIYRAFYTVFSWSNNFIMKGVPFLAIGILLRRHINRKVSLGAIALLYLVVTAGNIWIYELSGMKWAPLYFLQSIFLFSFCFGLGKTNEKDRVKKARFAQEMSSAMFFTHQCFIFIFSRFVDNLTLVFCLSVLSSIGLYLLLRKLQFKPYLWLINIQTTKNDQLCD